MRSILGLGLVALVSWGCSSSDDGGGTTPAAPAVLTDSVTLVPGHALVNPPDARSPADPDARQAMLDEGFGEIVEAAGQPFVTRQPAGVTVPDAGAGAELLTRFVHMPDLQLADDESPTRLASFDSTGATGAAFRPHDVDLCRMLNAAVKTVNHLHQTDPISFLLLGGDNADSAQKNEFDWVVKILSGSAQVECDSGADDDPLPGPDNDGKDAFDAPGLAMPWYWVTGNHDILVQGNLPVSDARNTTAIGDNCVGGTRDWSQPGGPVVTGQVVPDAERALLDRQQMIARVAGDSDGHGLGDAQKASGKAYYSFDVAGTPLRFVVLDTAAETGGSEGVIHQGDLDNVIKPLLDQALADGKWVALSSHHAVTSLGDGTGLGGTMQPDFVSQQAWTDFLGGYPNVRFSFVGHTHLNRVRYVDTPAGGFWEVMTSALADFPHQLRVIEIWDEDNGFIRVRATNMDFEAAGDPAAAKGRELGFLDYVSGWTPDGRGTAEDQNVNLYIAKP